MKSQTLRGRCCNPSNEETKAQSLEIPLTGTWQVSGQSWHCCKPSIKAARAVWWCCFRTVKSHAFADGFAKGIVKSQTCLTLLISGPVCAHCQNEIFSRGSVMNVSLSCKQIYIYMCVYVSVSVFICLFDWLCYCLFVYCWENLCLYKNKYSRRPAFCYLRMHIRIKTKHLHMGQCLG